MSNDKLITAAFPDQYQNGMDLRDYFAAKAMQALVTNNGTNPFEITKAAYVLADFMMKAREQ